MAERMQEMEEELARIDAVAGDGDHGRGMVRGTAAAFEAARAAESDGAGSGTILVSAGEAWAAKAGGTSGVLWGAALVAAGRCVGDEAVPSPAVVAAAVSEAFTAMSVLGKAKPGDKTMLDALGPFANTLASRIDGGEALWPAWSASCDVAAEAAAATAALRPMVGRARPLAERSVGTPDPGAVSMAACLTTVGQTLAGH
jgi:dihydroxyacetone kinase